MGRKSIQKLPAFVDVLVVTGARRLVSDAIIADPELAREVMRDIAHAICQQFARTVLYVPSDLDISSGRRDAGYE